MHGIKGRKWSRGQKYAGEKHSVQLWIISYKYRPWHGYLKGAKSRIYYRRSYQLLRASSGAIPRGGSQLGRLGWSRMFCLELSKGRGLGVVRNWRRNWRRGFRGIARGRRCGHGSVSAPQMALGPGRAGIAVPGILMGSPCLSGDCWKPDGFDKILINVSGSAENKV